MWIGVLLLFALGPGKARADDSDTRRAVDLSKRAISEYKRGAFRSAGDLFLEAFELSKRPAQLRNAAKAYEEGEILDSALSLWERYRRLNDISADERREADAHIDLIREKQKNAEILRTAEQAQRAAQAAKEEAQAAARAAETARARSSEVAPAETAVTAAPSEGSAPVTGYLLLGGGVLLGAGSATLWVIAGAQLGDLDDALARKDGAGLIIGTTPEQVEDEVGSINQKRVLSGVLLGAAVVSAALGVWWLLDDDEETTTAAHSRVLLPSPFVLSDEGAVGLGVAGRF